MEAMKRLALLVAFAALAACSNLLGLTAPREQTDAGHPNDARGGSSDASSDAGPVHVHVIVDGFFAAAPGSDTAGTVVTSSPGGIDCTSSRSGSADACDLVVAPDSSVTLTANDDTRFSGWVGVPNCPSSGLACTFTAKSDVTVWARWFGSNAGNIIFTSSTVQTPGSFDSTANADALCRTLATAAALPQNAGSGAGTFHAYLSDSQSSAASRVFTGLLGQTGDWARVDGALVAEAQGDLPNGHFLSPPRLDELGRDVGDDALAVTDTTITGAANSGTHCQDWASESAPGQVLAGEPVGGFGRWTAVTTVACNQPTHVYCISNVAGATFKEISPPGPIVWVSTGTVAGSAGLSAMDSLCQSEDTAHPSFPQTGVSALVTPGGGQSVASRYAGEAQFVSGPPQRSDGISLAPDFVTFLSGETLPVVPDLDADQNYVDDDVWAGAGGFDNFATDCSGWTTGSGSFGATRPAATTRAHTFFEQHACSEQHRVMCIALGAIAEP